MKSPATEKGQRKTQGKKDRTRDWATSATRESEKGAMDLMDLMDLISWGSYVGHHEWLGVDLVMSRGVFPLCCWYIGRLGETRLGERSAGEVSCRHVHALDWTTPRQEKQRKQTQSIGWGDVRFKLSPLDLILQAKSLMVNAAMYTTEPMSFKCALAFPATK